MSILKKEHKGKQEKPQRKEMIKRRRHAKTPDQKAEMVKECVTMNKRKTLNVTVDLWEKLQLLQEFEKSKSLSDTIEKMVDDRLEKDKLTTYFKFIHNVREATDEENEEIVSAIQEMTEDDLKTAKKYDI